MSHRHKGTIRRKRSNKRIPLGDRRQNHSVEQPVETSGYETLTAWQKIGAYEHEYGPKGYTGRHRAATWQNPPHHGEENPPLPSRRRWVFLLQTLTLDTLSTIVVRMSNLKIQKNSPKRPKAARGFNLIEKPATYSSSGTFGLETIGVDLFLGDRSSQAPERSFDNNLDHLFSYRLDQ